MELIQKKQKRTIVYLEGGRMIPKAFLEDLLVLAVAQPAIATASNFINNLKSIGWTFTDGKWSYTRPGSTSAGDGSLPGSPTGGSSTGGISARPSSYTPEGWTPGQDASKFQQFARGLGALDSNDQFDENVDMGNALWGKKTRGVYDQAFNYGGYGTLGDAYNAYTTWASNNPGKLISDWYATVNTNYKPNTPVTPEPIKTEIPVQNTYQPTKYLVSNDNFLNAAFTSGASRHNARVALNNQLAQKSFYTGGAGTNLGNFTGRDWNFTGRDAEGNEHSYNAFDEMNKAGLLKVRRDGTYKIRRGGMKKFMDIYNNLQLRGTGFDGNPAAAAALQLATSKLNPTLDDSKFIKNGEMDKSTLGNGVLTNLYISSVEPKNASEGIKNNYLKLDLTAPTNPLENKKFTI